METQLNSATRSALIEYITRLGDDRLVIGHRLSEWCGHGPILEEDIALANIALDNLGHAQLLLTLAAELEGNGRTADDLAFLRDAIEFRNVQLVELPRGDFAFTIMRQFLFDAFGYHLFGALKQGRFEKLAAISEKIHKENTYHLRHSGQWVVRLGDGTEESHARAQRALDQLWLYTDELFKADEIDQLLSACGMGAELSVIRDGWEKTIRPILSEATLQLPAGIVPLTLQSRKGSHSEHLGHLLAEMQILARSFPGAKW